MNLKIALVTHDRDHLEDTLFDLSLAAGSLKRYETEGRTASDLYDALLDLESELQKLEEERDRIARAAVSTAEREALA